MQCPKCQHENPDNTRFCGDCGEALGPSEGVSLTKTLITPRDSLKEGSTVGGRYTIIEELGRGGMGVVYKAKDTKLKRSVALKFLPPELTHIPEVKERFMREAQAAAALDHPNICTVYESDEAEGANFISMAYIEGQSLKEKIEAGPLGLEEALKIAEQVAEGLQEAHKIGIVHRDIKSANIMVSERGQAKIMDFGLARVAGSSLLTKDGSTMGTVSYMSPGQARGKEVDHRTDIWSFGVVLYELLTGKLPFQGEHEQAVIYSILKENPEPITNLRSDVPVSIEQVVEKALEKDADKRYQQVDELLDDLRSISAGIVPEEIKVRLRKKKLRKRKRAILYSGAAGLAIIIAVLALTLFTGRAEAIASIAVLPFENLTGDSKQAYFVDGVTDELIGQLGQISGLRRVISRTTIMQYKNSEMSLPEIARELNVDAIVEGTVYQAGDNVRIRVQLIDALHEEKNLWAQTYDRAKTDVLVMYSEIAHAIADSSRVNLTVEEKTRLTSANQVNPEAYDACLKGEYHIGRFTPMELGIALQYYELARQIDPSYAPAYVGVAAVWADRYQMGFVERDAATPIVMAALERAFELDDTLADAYTVRAAILGWGEYDWEGAEREYKHALELNPNLPYAHAFLSHVLSSLGRTEEALPHIEEALKLDPSNPGIQGLCAIALQYQRRYDDSLAVAETALEMTPGHPIAHFALQNAYILKGMRDEQLADQRQRISYDPERVAAFERGLKEGGYEGVQKAIADVLAARSNKFGKAVIPDLRGFPIAYRYLDAGEYELTLDWLEKAYEEKGPNLPYIALPIFDHLRSYPRFQDLLRKINLPVDEKE